MKQSHFRYPVFLDLQHKPVVVIGAGLVGCRKIQSLLEAGAEVTVYEPNPSVGLQELLQKSPQQLHWQSTFYVDQDLSGFFMIIAATNNPSLQESLAATAQKMKCLFNVIDNPTLGNFIVPSVYRQGDLQLAITTGGEAPAFSKYLRQKLEREWGTEYDALLVQLSAFREKINKIATPALQKQIWQQIFDLDPLTLVKTGQSDWVEKVEQWISSATA